LARRPRFHAEPTNVWWRNGAQCFLRLIPKHRQPERAVVELRELMQQGHLDPALGDHGKSFGASEYGQVVYSPTNEEDREIAEAFTLVSRRGELWGVSMEPLRRAVRQKIIPYLEPRFVETLDNYRRFVSDSLAIDPPYRVIVGIEGIRGCQIAMGPPPEGHYWRENKTGDCLYPEVVFEFELLDAAATSWELLTPFFDALYDACQARRPEHHPRK
jgi:hypothetical protein